MRTLHQGRRPLTALLGGLLATLMLAGPGQAAAPAAVVIVSHVTFNPDGPNFGDFEASGPAVLSGAICAEGTFVDTFIKFSGFQSDRGVVQLQVAKRMTCADDSGSFVVKLQIQANFDTGIESFSWVILGGDGAYTALRGSGSGSTVPEPPTGNINTYVGSVH
jgi:hypothetical protein